ncbi:hypothetical protein ACVWY5_004001 [Bradyrhizobium sp. USDA 3256]
MNTRGRLGHDGPLNRDHKLTERQTGALKKPVHNPREVAEIVAIQALGFIAGDPERLGLFLAETGIGPETLRNAASDPQFLASVLDFVMRDDATVTAFAKASELHPTNIAAARQALGDPKWERDVP